MAKDIRQQLLEQGLVKQADLPEVKRAAVNAARPPEPEKEFPPPFDAPARGVIVDTSKPRR